MYEILLLDEAGYELGSRQADTLKEAKRDMLCMLSEAYAKAGETTHAQLRTFKAEIRKSGELIIDRFI